MIKHVWTVLCKESTINQDDNVISLFGVIEELTVSLTPVKGGQKGEQKSPITERFNIPLKYELVSMWIRDEYEKLIKLDVEMILFNPKGQELNKFVQEIIIPAGIKRFRSRMKISGIVIQGEGEYYFKVGIKEKGKEVYKTVSELPLEVKIKVEQSIDKAN